MGLEQTQQIGGPSAATSGPRTKVLERTPGSVQDSQRQLESCPPVIAPNEWRPEIFDLSQNNIDRAAYYEGIPAEDYRIIAKITQEITKSTDLRNYKSSEELDSFVSGEILKKLEAYPKTKEIYQRHLASPDTARIVSEKRIQLFNFVFSALTKEERELLMSPVKEAIKKALEDGAAPEAALFSADVQKAYYNMELAVKEMAVYKEALAELFSKDKLFAEIYTAQDTFRAQEMAKVSGRDTVISAFVFSYNDEEAIAGALGKMGIDRKMIEKGQTRQMAAAGGLTENEAVCLLKGLEGLMSSRLWVVSLDEKSATESFLAEKPEALAAYRKMCENTRPIPELGRAIYKKMIDGQIKMLQTMPDSPEKQEALSRCEKSAADLAKMSDKEIGISLVQAAGLELRQIQDKVRSALLKTDKQYIAMVQTYSATKAALVEEAMRGYLADPKVKEKLAGLSPDRQNLMLESIMLACEASVAGIPQLKALEIRIGTYESTFRNQFYAEIRDEIAAGPYGKSLVDICDSMIKLENNELEELFQTPKKNEQILSA